MAERSPFHLLPGQVRRRRRALLRREPSVGPHSAPGWVLSMRRRIKMSLAFPMNLSSGSGR